MFSQSALKWTTATALQHVETFAGMMSVTRGEWKDGKGFKRRTYCLNTIAAS